MKTFLALLLAFFTAHPAFAQLPWIFVCNGTTKSIGMVKVHPDFVNPVGTELSYSESVQTPRIVFETSFTEDHENSDVMTWTGVRGAEMGVLTIHPKKKEQYDYAGVYTRIRSGKAETFNVDCYIPD